MTSVIKSPSLKVRKSELQLTKIKTYHAAQKAHE